MKTYFITTKVGTNPPHNSKFEAENMRQALQFASEALGSATDPEVVIIGEGDKIISILQAHIGERH